MRVKRAFCIFVLVFFSSFLFACERDKTHDGSASVKYELEGAKYKNSDKAVIQYYKLKDGSSCKIYEPAYFSGENNKITNTGFTFEGWFKTKTVDGDNVTYSDPWNFETDTLKSTDQITLYAYWKKISKFKFNVCYLNDDNERVVLGTYDSEEGQVFSDYSKHYNKRTGYTALARYENRSVMINYYDVNGNLLPSDYKHPGSALGENVNEADVYVKFVRGRFNYVYNYADLSRYAKTGNIYLLSDIDCNGGKLSFGDYRYQLIGNGHTISNFELNYPAGKNDLKPDLEDSSRNSLYVSLFGSMSNANVSDVNFENMSVNISTSLTLTYKIYVAPFAVDSTNSTASGVTVKGTYKVSTLPNGFDSANLIIATDRPMVNENQTGISVTVDFKEIVENK